MQAPAGQQALRIFFHVIGHKLIDAAGESDHLGRHVIDEHRSIDSTGIQELEKRFRRAAKLDGPSIRDALATTKNFPGVTGNITIGPDRNAVGKKMIIEEVRNGQPTLKAIIQPNAGAIQVISPQ